MKSTATSGSAKDTYTCAFCGGKGEDPFDLLSKLSTCQVCMGRETVKVKQPAIECPYCRGSGVQPHRRITCQVCGGSGMVTIPEKSTACPECGGRGVTTGHLPCLKCHGTGRIEQKKAGKQKKRPLRKVDKEGRIRVPKEMASETGLEPGTPVEIEVGRRGRSIIMHAKDR